MRYIALFILLSILSGCTISVSLAHTNGLAVDTIDSDPSTSTDADADLTVPMSVL